MENIIEINHLNKSFGDVKAVNDLSFRVKTGELFAFLGVNGAGKSTTISIMCGQLAKDSGEVCICGKSVDGDMKNISGRLGVVFQNSALDKALSVKDNLRPIPTRIFLLLSFYDVADSSSPCKQLPYKF